MGSRNALALGFVALVVLLVGADLRRAQARAPGPSPAAASLLRFRPVVPEAERARILASVARSRPLAQALVAAVGEPIDVGLHDGGPLGRATTARGRRASITFDAAALHERGEDVYDHAVLHELAHVVDAALVDDALLARLDAAIPRTQACTTPGGRFGGCAEPEERFADTFAKWAMNRPPSAPPLGYGVEAPPSLERWALPLMSLARPS